MKHKGGLAIILALLLTLVGAFSVNVFALPDNFYTYFNNWTDLKEASDYPEYNYYSVGSRPGYNKAIVYMNIKDVRPVEYDGKQKKINIDEDEAVRFTYGDANTTLNLYSVEYKPAEGTTASLVDGFPVHVGSYDAIISFWNAQQRFQVKDVTLKNAITITKADLEPGVEYELATLSKGGAYDGTEPYPLINQKYPGKINFPAGAKFMYRYSTDGENWSEWDENPYVNDVGEYTVQYKIAGLPKEDVNAVKGTFEKKVELTHAHVWELSAGTKDKTNKAYLKCLNEVGAEGACDYQKAKTVVEMPNDVPNKVANGKEVTIDLPEVKNVPDDNNIKIETTARVYYFEITKDDEGNEQEVLLKEGDKYLQPKEPGKYVAKVKAKLLQYNKKSDDYVLTHEDWIASNEFVIHGHTWNFRQGEEEEQNKAFLECTNELGNDVCDYLKPNCVAQMRTDIKDVVYSSDISVEDFAPEIISEKIPANDVKVKLAASDGLYFIKDGKDEDVDDHLQTITESGNYVAVAKLIAKVNATGEKTSVKIVSNKFTVHKHVWTLRAGTSSVEAKAKAMLYCANEVGKELCDYQRKQGEKSIAVMPYELPDKDYDGEPYVVDAPKVNEKHLPKELAVEDIKIGTVKYFKITEENPEGVELSTAPVNSGKYIAKVYVWFNNDKQASINKVQIQSNEFSISHVHIWNLKKGSGDNSRKAYLGCQSKDKTKCGYQKVNQIAEMPGDVDSKVFDGKPLVVEATKLTDNIPEELKKDVKFSPVLYLKKGEAVPKDSAVSIGEYTAFIDITYGDQTVRLESNEFAITKQIVGIKWEVEEETTPTYTYNGKPQAPKAYFFKSDGLDTRKFFDADISGKKTDASDTPYTATASIPEKYRKNCEFKGDEAELSCEFKIEPKTATLTWDEDEFIYNGGHQQATATVDSDSVVDRDKDNIPKVTAYIIKEGEAKVEQTIKVGAYTITANGLDNTNYKLPDEAGSAYSIVKATPTLTAPTASDITLGQSLKSSKLSGGSATYADGKDVDGEFAWSDETITPNKAGVGKYAVTFAPVDTDNFKEATVEVSVNINSPAPAPTPGGGGSVTDPVDDLVKMINALDPNSATYAADCQAVVDAYNALSPELQQDGRLKVETVASKLAGAFAEVQSEADKKAAQPVVDQINALTENSTKAEVEAARAAYEALTPAQQAACGTALFKLQGEEYRIYSGEAKAKTVKNFKVKNLKTKKSAKTRKVKATWTATSGVDGYVLTYKAKGTKTKKATLNESAVKKTVSKLKKNKKYTFKIRTFNEVYNPITGEFEKVYGKTSKKSIKTNK